MIAESVAFLVAQGKRVIYDAEHFFDGYRDDRDYALGACAPRPRPAPSASCLCDTNGGSLPAQIARGAAAVVRAALAGVRSASTATTTPGCGVANTLAAVEAGATQVQGTINGVRRAHRQREPRLDHRQPPAQARPQVPRPERLARLTETAHFVDELLNLAPDPDQPYVGKTRSPTRAGMHVAGVRADAATFEHVDPELVGNRRDLLVSELAGKRDGAEKAPGAGLELDERRRRARGRARQGARAPRLPLRGGRRLVRAADAARDGRLRAAVPARVVARDRRAARRRQGRDRGDDQDLGRRRALRAHGRGQRPGQRARQGAARRDPEIHPHLADIELVNFKVRILDEAKGTGAVTRVLLDASDGHDVWGSIGVSENVIEASWEALVDSLEYAMQPGGAAPRRPRAA